MSEITAIMPAGAVQNTVLRRELGELDNLAAESLPFSRELAAAQSVDLEGVIDAAKIPADSGRLIDDSGKTQPQQLHSESQLSAIVAPLVTETTRVLDPPAQSRLHFADDRVAIAANSLLRAANTPATNAVIELGQIVAAVSEPISDALRPAARAPSPTLAGQQSSVVAKLPVMDTVAQSVELKILDAPVAPATENPKRSPLISEFRTNFTGAIAKPSLAKDPAPSYGPAGETPNARQILVSDSTAAQARGEIELTVRESQSPRHFIGENFELAKMSETMSMPTTQAHQLATLGAANPTTATNDDMASRISVFEPTFEHDLGERLTILAKNGSHNAKINLHPAELGPVEVRISITKDDVSVQLASQHGAVREVIDDALPRLREMLEQVGLKLTNSGVFSEFPQQQARDHYATNDSAADPMNTDEIDIDPNDLIAQTVINSQRLVDTYI